MDKREMRKLENILLHHLMYLNLPIENWKIEDDIVVVQWMEGKEIKEKRYDGFSLGE